MNVYFTIRLKKRTFEQLTVFLAIFLFFSFFQTASFSQETSAKTKMVIAGKDYSKSATYQRLWGKHYRTEWGIPVQVPLFFLDTAAGGLTPYQAGGGRQSKSLRLRNNMGKEYVLRSIDKSFGKALPDIFQNTFVEAVVNDQVTIAHPYAAVTIGPLAEAAGIYHTWPEIVYVPKQPALESFNESFGDNLYLFEQRPDENWEEAANFGFSKNIVGTEKLLEKLRDDNDNRVDQQAYIRARLFDMFIGDWGRHEDQWRWASYKQGKKTTYKPIPRDRDQAYTLFDGALVKLVLSLADLDHLQTFGANISDVARFNFPARNLDRQLANETTRDNWIATAKELQQALTDEKIQLALQQLPTEVFSVSGQKIIDKLIKRRNGLEKAATDYYLTLANEVDIVGSNEEEYFSVNRLNNKETLVQVFKINKEGVTEQQPLYSRVFKGSETKEVRLYGLEGKDVYKIEGTVEKGPIIRVIGGADKDTILDASGVRGKKSTHIYDDKNNVITTSKSTKLHLSTDTAIHLFKYDAFEYDTKGFKPVVFYDSDDRFFVGIGYSSLKHKWRTTPFASKHTALARYSLTQKALSFTYKGSITNVIGKWSLDLLADFDAIKWNNFFGVGNNTPLLTKESDFYRTRSKEVYLSPAFRRMLGKDTRITFAPFYQLVDIVRDDERFVAKSFGDVDGLNSAKHFAGISAGVAFSRINNVVVPTNGVQLGATATYTQNIKTGERNFTRYNGEANFFIPFLNSFVLAVRNGAATLTGTPEFYQLNGVGGSSRLRGYRFNRFMGTTSFYNSNEVQYIFNVRSYLLNGKAGLIGFYDQGRVWQKGEHSTDWHAGWGGGIMVAPFNLAMVSVSYGISPENSIFHIRLSRSF